MKTLRIFTMFALSCALLSCGNEKDGDIPQLPSPKVIQDEAKTTKTSVAAFWTEVAGAASYNVIFDDRDVVSTTEKEMAWDNLETNSTHTLKVQAVSADKNAFKDSEWSVAVLTTTEDTELDTPFTMSFHDVTFYNAKVTVNAGNYTDKYFFNVTPKVLFDKDYNGDVRAFAEDYIAQVKQLAELSEKTFGDMYLILSYSGKMEGTVPSLASETEYIAIVFGVDINGLITTGVASETFKTEKDPGVQKSDMTFEINVEQPTGTSAIVEVTPSKDDEYYFFTAINKSQLSTTVGGDTDEAILNYYSKLFDAHLKDESFEEFASKNFSKGKDSYNFAALPDNCDYLVVAFGVTYHGEICMATTDLARKEFKTGEGAQKPGEKDIEIVVNKLTATDLEFTVVPSDDKLYFVYDWCSYDEFKGLTDEEIMTKVIKERSGDGYFWLTASKGAMTGHNTNPLTTGKEYIIYAFYVEEDPNNAYSALPASGLFKKIVVPGEGEAQEPTLSFTISEDEVTSSSLKATVTPSDATAKYFSYVLEASKCSEKTDEEIVKAVKNELGYEILGYEKTGTTVVSQSKLKSNTEYYVVVFGVDPDKDYAATTSVTKRLFKTKVESTTPPSGEKAIDINVKELTATKISVDFVPGDSDMEYVASIYKAAKFEGMSDEQIIKSVIEDYGYEIYFGLPKGKYNITRDAFSPNTEYVIVAFGVKNGSAITGLFKQSVTTPAE